MIELYWITRLDTICNVLTIFIILGIISLLFWLAGKAYIAGNEGDSYCDNDIKAWKAVLKYCKYTIVAGITSTILICFVPTTKSALLIYGVGSTIDYLKTSDKAKQLPDKAIVALDKYLESIGENKEEDCND